VSRVFHFRRRDIGERSEAGTGAAGSEAVPKADLGPFLGVAAGDLQQRSAYANGLFPEDGGMSGRMLLTGRSCAGIE